MIRRTCSPEKSYLVRVGGIEPPSRPWQGRVIPLNYTRFSSHKTLIVGKVYPREGRNHKYEVRPAGLGDHVARCFSTSEDSVTKNHSSPDVRKAVCVLRFWCARQDSNPQPLGPKPSALSIELRAQNFIIAFATEKSKFGLLYALK